PARQLSSAHDSNARHARALAGTVHQGGGAAGRNPDGHSRNDPAAIAGRRRDRSSQFPGPRGHAGRAGQAGAAFQFFAVPPAGHVSLALHAKTHRPAARARAAARRLRRKILQQHAGRPDGIDGTVVPQRRETVRLSLSGPENRPADNGGEPRRSAAPPASVPAPGRQSAGGRPAKLQSRVPVGVFRRSAGKNPKGRSDLGKIGAAADRGSHQSQKTFRLAQLLSRPIADNVMKTILTLLMLAWLLGNGCASPEQRAQKRHDDLAAQFPPGKTTRGTVLQHFSYSEAEVSEFRPRAGWEKCRNPEVARLCTA